MTEKLKERPVTASKALRDASALVARQDPAEHAQYLLRTIGPRYATVGLGLADARQLKAWAAGENHPREHAVAERLQLLAQVVHAITALYPPKGDGAANVAAAFLRGANPDLEDHAPLLVIANSSSPATQGDVLRALRAFLEA